MTSTAQRLLEATSSLPEPLLAEVLDFAEFLQSRHNSKLNQAPASPTRRAIDGILGTWKHQLQNSTPTSLEKMARLQIEALEEKHLGSR